MKIEFGEWLPDLRDGDNPGSTEANNCIALVDGYSQLKSLQTFTDALTGACLGSVWFADDNQNIYNFAGDADDLYQLSASLTWSNVSKSLNAYSATSHWEFQRFGERVIAVNDADTPQYFDMGVSSAFADLPNAPTASRIAVVRDFVVMGDLASNPNTIQWSGFNNSELWTPSQATQSDSQDLKGNGGRVQKIVPGEYGVIFQEHSISRMDYVGPPVIFQIDEIEVGAGTPSPDSVVWFKNLVFYYGYDGFYVFDGVQSRSISDNRVSDWMEDNLDPSAASNMQGVFDRQNGLVMWAFSSSGSVNNKLIIYNVKADRWSHADVTTQHIAEYASGGYDLDTLTSSLGLADIDTASFRVDSSVYKGGALNVVAFDSTNKAATFDGAALAATITTKEIGMSGKRMNTRGVRPLVEGSSSASTVRIGSRSKPEGNVSYSLGKTTNDYGIADIRKNERFQRFEVSITGGFDHAYGVDVEARVHSGRR